MVPYIPVSILLTDVGAWGGETEQVSMWTGALSNRMNLVLRFTECGTG